MLTFEAKHNSASFRNSISFPKMKPIHKQLIFNKLFESKNNGFRNLTPHINSIFYSCKLFNEAAICRFHKKSKINNAFFLLKNSCRNIPLSISGIQCLNSELISISLLDVPYTWRLFFPSFKHLRIFSVIVIFLIL
jgi:hypothetical protein